MADYRIDCRNLTEKFDVYRLFVVVSLLLTLPTIFAFISENVFVFAWYTDRTNYHTVYRLVIIMQERTCIYEDSVTGV